MTASETRALSDPRWVKPSLGALLVATAAFWAVGLSRNGWGNTFYAAAVQAGTRSGKAFLFGSSDAANSITVDKPPASLWVMEISTRLFGVNSWALQLPQVLLGVVSVGLLYASVRKPFGPAAGLIAGALLALTPVATLMFRYNNPDALLVFLMVAATWALLRGVDSGRTRWVVLCGALIGFGFLTKQLQVMLILPGLASPTWSPVRRAGGGHDCCSCSPDWARPSWPPAGGWRWWSCGRRRTVRTSAVPRTTAFCN